MKFFKLFALPIFAIGTLASNAMGIGIDEVLVKRIEDTTSTATTVLMRSLDLKGGVIRQRIAGPEILVVRVPVGRSTSDYITALRESGDFALVEQNQIVGPCADPNDPSFNTQWHLSQISAPVAWNFTTGTSGKVVAICDSGVALTHPDLVQNLVPGYNTISGLSQANGGLVTDIHSSGHGTRCMGIAVAEGNNNIGISGVGWGLKGMPIRVTNNTDGTTPVSELLEGVTWAVNNGADVVSVSYEGLSNNAIEATGAWARTQGALLVWAAGNSNTNLSAFDYWNVTVVGATDRNDVKLATSSYGRAVDIWAPGTQIYTTNKTNGYGNAPQGTSFATPQVAATLALIMERNPTWTPEKVERQMFLTARDIGAVGFDTVYGYGRLNTGQAVWNPDPQWILNELPLPAGYNGATQFKMNSNGDYVAANSSNLYYFPHNGLAQTIPLPEGNHAPWIELRGFNNARTVVGIIGTIGNRPRGFSWNPTTGFYLHPPDSRFTGINEAGDIVGFSVQGALLIRNGVVTLIQETFSNALFVNNASCVAYAINNLGNIAAQFAAGGSFPCYILDRYDGNFSQSFNYGPNIQTYGDDISESGFSTGYFYDPSQNNYTSFYARSNVRDQVSLSPNLSRVLNESGAWSDTSRGISVNNAGEVVGYSNNVSVPFFYDGLRYINPSQYVALDEFEPVPALTPAWDINESGDIALGKRDGSNVIPVKLTRDRNLTYVMNMGQLGASPTYIGTIPPVVAIQFANEAGVFLPGDPVLNPYDRDSGRITVGVPPEVGGTFRMRLMCNPIVTPGYTGAGYLSKIVPPLNQPGWPLDAFGRDPTALIQGDCDSDNEIGPGDFEMVVAMFGTVDGEAGWDPRGDVDGDGEVGPSDFEIIVENFGLAGE